MLWYVAYFSYEELLDLFHVWSISDDVSLEEILDHVDLNGQLF